MGKNEHPPKPLIRGEVSPRKITEEQYPTSGPAVLRLYFYKFAESHNPEYDEDRYHHLHVTDIHHIQIQHLQALGMSPNTSVLDIGCGDGSTTLNFAMNYGHTGNLTGVNINSTGYEFGEQEAMNWLKEQGVKAAREGGGGLLPKIEFKVGDAEGLPVNVKGVDVALLNFLLYHLDNPDRAIDEALDALKPGGFLSIATRGVENMERMWAFCEEMGDDMDAVPPSSFYFEYPIERLDHEMADRGLFPLSQYEQFEDLLLPRDILLEDYLLLFVMQKNHFWLNNPPPGGSPHPSFKALQNSFNKIVLPAALEELNSDPDKVFREKVRQAFRIYQKPHSERVLPRNLSRSNLQ